MQKSYYDREASKWSLEEKDFVVGQFHKHNLFKSYELLFENINDCKDKSMLDFGCGPGRCLALYSKRFKRIDGVDISEINLQKAVIYLKDQKCDLSKHNLYKCNGTDLKDITTNSYDVVMSVLTLQHICVYDIRFNYFKEFLRVLKPGGTITLQMGFGIPNRKQRLLDHPNKQKRLAVNYYENFYEAVGTNGRCDVLIEDIEQLQKDLYKCGFKNFKYTLSSPGPNQRNAHPFWVFFSAKKPLE